MSNTMVKRNREFIESVAGDLGIESLTLVSETEEGLEYTFDPEIVTAHQAQSLIESAEVFTRFSDYGFDVSSNTVHFKY